MTSATLIVTGLAAPAQATTPSPPPLIVDYNRVPTASIPAVQRFEDRARDEVLTDFGLPSSDAAAVRGWARNEIRAQLWVDLAAVITKSASSRTADEALVYAWFQSIVQTNLVTAARAALAEYFRFSGRTEADYLDPGAWAQPFGPGGTGYCNYQMPDPYADQYTGRLDPLCFTPPTDLTAFSFLPATPSFDQFAKLGTLAAEKSVLTSLDFTRVSMGTTNAIASGVTLSGTTAAIPLARGLATGAIATGKIAQEIFPFAARAATIGFDTTAEALAAIAEAATVSAAQVAGAVTAIVGAAVEIIVTVVISSIEIAKNDALPVQLRDLVAGALSTAPDLTRQLTDGSLTADQKAANYTGLYALFLGATTPEATPGCTDSGPVIGGGAYNIACANAPAAPAPTGTDPVWQSTAEGSNTSTLSRSVVTRDRFGEDLSTYASGVGWFVHSKSNTATGATGAVVPSLRLPYVDWQGKSWVATRNGVTGGATTPDGRTFVISPDGGGAATDCPVGGCISAALQVTRPDGGHMTVQLVSPPPPSTQLWAPRYPGTVVAGQVATYSVDPTLFSAGTTFAWTYNCDWSCPIPIDGSPRPTTLTQFGASTSFALVNSGDQPVTLLATSTLGTKQKGLFTVHVQPAIGKITFSQPEAMRFYHPLFSMTYASQHLNAWSNASYYTLLRVADASRAICEVSSTVDPTKSSYANGLLTITGQAGATVTALGAGTCTITASSGFDLPWTPPDPVTRSLEIGKDDYTDTQAYGPVQYSDPLPTSPSSLGLAPAGTTGAVTGCTWPSSLTTPTGTVAAGPAYYGRYGCTGLSNPNYTISYDGYVQVTPEDATLAVAPTPTSNPGTAAVSVTLTQAADGTLGDLSKATVDVLLFRAGNTGTTPDAVAKDVPVSTAGRAVTVLTALPVDSYRVEARTAAGSWFTAPLATGSVTVLGPAAPTVTRQPVATTVIAGRAATFVAAATGRPLPSVRWQASTDAGATWRSVTGATSATLTVPSTTAAASGTRYRALFSSTAGTVTSSSALLTVLSAPSPPRAVLGSPRVTSAVVTWSAPQTLGGAVITSYVVTAAPGGRQCKTTGARTCTVTGLATRTAYRFSVRATNRVGTSAASTLSPTIVIGTPTAPRSFAVSQPASGTARASWAAPALVNAGPVTAYQVRWSGDGGRTWTTWTATKLLSLTRGSLRPRVTYLVQVRALNRAGAGLTATLRFVQTR